MITVLVGSVTRIIVTAKPARDILYIHLPVAIDCVAMNSVIQRVICCIYPITSILAYRVVIYPGMG